MPTPQTPCAALAALALGLAGASLTCAAEPKDPAAALKRGLPRPAAAVVDRIFYCQHFAGEEPYDAQRKADIAAAMAKYRCEALYQDEKRVLDTYKTQPLVQENITKAKNGEW